MDLTKLTQLKTNSLTESFDQLKDINGIIGIMDNTAASLSSLIALAIPNHNFINSLKVMDDVYGAYPNNRANNTAFPNTLGYLFDLKQDYKLQLQSDITDHYTEENFVVHDNVANKPIILTLTGKIAELDYNSNYYNPDNQKRAEMGVARDLERGAGTNKSAVNYLNGYDSLINKAGSISSLAPGLVDSATSIKNTAGMAYGLYNNGRNLGKNIWSAGKSLAGKKTEDDSLTTTSETIDDLYGKQYKAIREYYYTWWKNKTPFVVLTPFGAFSNMYILDFVAVQDETTRYVTNVQIVFKEMRVAKTRVYSPSSSDRVALQKSKNDATPAQDNTGVEWDNYSVGSRYGQYVKSTSGIVTMSESENAIYGTNMASKIVNSGANAAASNTDIVRNQNVFSKYTILYSGTGDTKGGYRAATGA